MIGQPVANESSADWYRSFVTNPILHLDKRKSVNKKTLVIKVFVSLFVWFLFFSRQLVVVKTRFKIVIDKRIRDFVFGPISQIDNKN